MSDYNIYHIECITSSGTHIICLRCGIANMVAYVLVANHRYSIQYDELTNLITLNSWSMDGKMRIIINYDHWSNACRHINVTLPINYNYTYK